MLLDNHRVLVKLTERRLSKEESSVLEWSRNFLKEQASFKLLGDIITNLEKVIRLLDMEAVEEVRSETSGILCSAKPPEAIMPEKKT